ncbi:MAG: V-type ATP synthase subunit E [Bacteroidetes bacterium]|nr:V-type ATP synthase subunit E [Bacteroidota bacterium]
MENKLQLLTNKIYEEGVVKAQEEASTILAEAREKADAIVTGAEQKARNILEHAQRESEELRENVQSEIRLSARQAISGLKQEIANIITFRANTVPMNDAFNDKDFLKVIIELAVKNWSENGHTSDANLSLILPEKAQENIDQYLKSELKKQLNKGIELQFSKSIGNGFRIGPDDGSYVVSFTEKDFDNLFQEYLRPKTIQLLFGNK